MNDSHLNLTAEELKLLETFKFPNILEYSHHFHKVVFPFSVVVNAVTLYTICKRTDKSGGAVKFYILWHQICLAFNDLYIGLLMQPVGFYPHLVVISTGYLKHVLHSYYGSCLLMGFLYETACMTSCTIFYRYQHVLPIGHFLKIHKKNRIHYICASLFVLSFLFGFFSLYILKPDSKQELEECFLKNFSYMRPIVETEGAYVRHRTALNTAFSVGILIIFALCVGISSLMIFLSFKVTDSTVSEKTRKLQRAFTRKLSFQLIFPIYLLGAPGLYLSLSTICQYHSIYSGCFNLATLMFMSSHSIISSITTILVWKSYRVFVSNLIRHPMKMFNSTALHPDTNPQQNSTKIRSHTVTHTVNKV